MRIRFVQFGGILECKKEKDEELKGLKDRTGEFRGHNPAECRNALGFTGHVRSQDKNFGSESISGSQAHFCRFVLHFFHQSSFSS
jgi:hypothetical protein